jgi:hypothetical protein
MYIKPIHFISLLSSLLIGTVAISQNVNAAELVMFESSTCEWCDRWHEEIGSIYPMTPEGKCAPLRQVAIGGERPAHLSEISPTRFTPTFVMVEEGREVGRLVGYAGEDFFWFLLAEQLKKLASGCTNVGGKN